MKEIREKFSHSEGTKRLGLEAIAWRWRIGVPLAVMVLFILVASAGFVSLVPSLSWVDALYLSVVTVSTLNNDTGNQIITPEAKLWSIFVIAVGLVLMAAVGTQLAAFVVENQIRGILGRRKVKKNISELSGHTLVCGFGKMGSMVARELRHAGKEVVVVEKNLPRAKSAEDEGFLVVPGDAQEDSILAEAGLENASVLLAALRDDAANLFLTLSARQQRPGIQIIARVQGVENQSKLRRAGANRVVCPHVIGASRMIDVVLRPAMVDFVEMAHKGVDLEMEQLVVRQAGEMAGKTLNELELPRRFGAHVVAILSADDRANYHPRPDEALEVGDRLIVVGRVGTIDSLAVLAGAETNLE